MKGQLSLEMLVVLAVILGLIIIVASTMMKSANRASEKIEEKTGAVLNASDGRVGASGDYCVTDADCGSASCDTYLRKCR